MRTRIFIYFSLFAFHFSLSQSWEPVGGGITNRDSTLAPVMAMCVYDTKLYIGGSFTQVGNLQANNITCWNGTKWDTLTNGVEGRVNALCAYDNTLIIGGFFYSAGRTIKYNYARDSFPGVNIAMWMDTIHTIPRWYQVSDGVGFNSDENDNPFGDCVRSLCVYNDNLYVGGFYGVRHYREDCNFSILRWNYSTGKWSQLMDPKLKLNRAAAGHLDSDLGGELGFVTALAVFKGKLYIGSELHIEGPQSYDTALKVVEYGDSGFVEEIGKGMIKTGPAGVRSMAVYDSNLYVGGYYYSKPQKLAGISRWDGNKWSVVGKGEWDRKGTVFAMTEYQGRLYIGGRFDSIAGKRANNIAVWDGKTLEPVGAGFSGKGRRAGVVRTLCVYKGELYAGGEFYSSGNKPVMNIARLKLPGKSER
jgi:hypothetical protein